VSPFKTHDHSIDSGGLGIYEVKIVIHPDEHQIEDNRCVLYKKIIHDLSDLGFFGGLKKPDSL
jgi:hypothetical protein